MQMGIPSLVGLCIQTTINNVRYLGDVGETDLDLLDQILPHCSIDQLKHVENCSKGRDLTPITDKLWKKFFELEFGVRSVNIVVGRMKRKNVSIDWKRLFEAKLKDVDEAQEKSIERIKELYKKEDARKQSRQVKICTKTPPSGNKRNWGGNDGFGGRFSNTKSGIMKKAKLEFRNSPEVKNLAALRDSRNSSSSSISRHMSTTKRNCVASPSTSKPAMFMNTRL